MTSKIIFALDAILVNLVSGTNQYVHYEFLNYIRK